ncbi:MAG TPA: CDP-alcohol phosphatidyltransferase family protein [Terriglobales bacterium]|nr:CDP-alcohol phosphatidyltransferase family protein [Terriglobales bacterium]
MTTTTNVSLPTFRNAPRLQQAVTANVERKLLLAMARRAPAWMTADHLTLLGFAAQFAAGVSYAFAGKTRHALLAASFFIALNWLGDSLDGTLARHRNHLRPRYGFYVDHMIDTFGAGFLTCGLAISGYLHWQIALAMLIAFLVLSVETYLSTYTMGTFRLSHGLLGPTEIRILLIIGNFALLRSPYAHLFGRQFLLFDVGGVIASAAMLGMAVISTVAHTRQLYREEPLP